MKAGWKNQALVVVAGLTAFLWFLQMRRAPANVLERRDCEHAYATARTMTDTAAIDRRRPLGVAPGDGLTCGALRASQR